MRDDFPIHTQTSSEDRRILLELRNVLRKNFYAYAEIGSFLGGSLVPFLSDPLCHKVLSIDDRERVQPDERGASFDYAGITSRDMVDNLKKERLDISKLTVFDGSIDSYANNHVLYDILFIDGEHTDLACVRDFLYGSSIIKKDSVVCFHDSTIVYKGIKIICEILKFKSEKFKLRKIAHSEIAFILLGEYVDNVDLLSIGEVEPSEQFFQRSERAMLMEVLRNRVIASNTSKGIQLQLRAAPVKKAF